MEWISVKDRLPENDASLPLGDFGHLKVISVLAAGYINSGSSSLSVREVNRCYASTTGVKYIDDEAGVLDAWQWSRAFHEITHWMPLPAPPKEQP